MEPEEVRTAVHSCILVHCHLLQQEIPQLAFDPAPERGHRRVRRPREFEQATPDSQEGAGGEIAGVRAIDGSRFGDSRPPSASSSTRSKSVESSAMAVSCMSPHAALHRKLARVLFARLEPRLRPCLPELFPIGFRHCLASFSRR